MPIATPEIYAQMLDRAKQQGFAYPAVNVTSTQTLNAALRGFATAESDGIVQISTGGAEYLSGSLKNMVTGASALAEFARTVAAELPVNIALHTDHCPKDHNGLRASRRWLHDKFERLAAEEGQLSTGRAAYYAAIGTVLITGLLVVLADLLGEPSLLVVAVTFLAGLGILISLVWAVLLHRTNDAQNLWREAARLLERDHPPIEGIWNAPITFAVRRDDERGPGPSIPRAQRAVRPHPPGLVDGSGQPPRAHRGPSPDVHRDLEFGPGHRLVLVPRAPVGAAADAGPGISDVGLGHDPTVPDRDEQQPVIALRLIGVGFGEIGDRLVKDGLLPR